MDGPNYGRDEFLVVVEGSEVFLGVEVWVSLDVLLELCNPILV